MVGRCILLTVKVGVIEVLKGFLKEEEEISEGLVEEGVFLEVSVKLQAMEIQEAPKVISCDAMNATVPCI